jgi:uncharacterized protein YqgC (DUF456 family)
MLRYDHQRTEQIIESLMYAERLVRLITMLSSIVFVTLIGFSTGASTRTPEGTVIGAIIGAVIGLGSFSMILLSAMIEWMCQILIAQGRVLFKVGSACRAVP